MTDIIEELTGGGTAPPWLSGPLKEAREMAYYAKLIALIFALIELLVGVAYLIWAPVSGIISIVFAFGMVFLALNIQRKIINAIDQNRVAQAKSDITLWMILGIVFGIIPGILLFISKSKMDEAAAGPQYAAPGQAPPAQYSYGQQPGYQQPPAQQYGQPQPTPQPQQYNQPPAYSQPTPQPTPQPAAPQPQYQAPPQPVTPQPQPGAAQPMGMDGTILCPSCGAQIPPYMHTCPKCGAPRPGTQL